jgi:putative transposase
MATVVDMMVEKKIKGRKRSIVVDHEGHLLHVHVSAANEHDTVLGCEVLEQVIGKYPTIETICADAGYRGLFVEFAQSVIGISVAIVKKIKGRFKVQPKRWIVERTFAWLNNARRLAKDIEVNPIHSENMIRIAMITMTLKQLTYS